MFIAFLIIIKDLDHINNHSIRLILVFVFLVNNLFAQTKYFSLADLDEKKQTNLEGKFKLSEIPKFIVATDSNKLFLENGYASSVIKNSEELYLKKEGYQVAEINLIYSKYPVNKNLWRTNYRKLLINRLKVLFKLDSSLNSGEIEWNILLQTSCKNEKQAKLLPHGIEIVYNLIPTEFHAINKEVGSDVTTISDTLNELISAENQVKDFIKLVNTTQKSIIDSTIEKVYGRHPEWKNSLVIMDWTGSMQEFGATVILWHIQNFEKSGIKYLVIFNDGQHGKKRKTGEYGGIYFTEASDLKKVIKLMKKARNEMIHNDEIEENNVEAIIKGINKFKAFDQLIMIADNRSCMKDYCLIDEINYPVRVVLCGTQGGINPQYVNLAYRTNGSIHTIENDIYNLPGASIGNKQIKIENSLFIFDNKNNRYIEIDTPNQKGYQDCSKFYKKKC